MTLARPPTAQVIHQSSASAAAAPVRRVPQQYWHYDANLTSVAVSISKQNVLHISVESGVYTDSIWLPAGIYSYWYALPVADKVHRPSRARAVW